MVDGISLSYCLRQPNRNHPKARPIITAAVTPIAIPAFGAGLSPPCTAFEVVAVEKDVSAAPNVMVLVPELVEEAEVLVIKVEVTEEEVVMLALDSAIVFLMVKMSLCARTFVCVSR